MLTRLVAALRLCFHLVASDDEWCLSRGWEKLPSGRTFPLATSCLCGSVKSRIMSVDWTLVPNDSTLAMVV